MAFSNLGFETEHGTLTGIPANWSLFINSAGMRTAGYSATTPGNYPFEDFERDWSSNEDFLFVYTQPFDVLEVEQAIYDSTGTYEGVEDFEELWSSNESFLFSRGSISAADYDTTTDPYEDFEEEWLSNEDFMFKWSDVQAGPGEDSADYDTTTDPYEDFEEEWNSNENYHFSRMTLSLAVANYDGEAYEDFEEVLAPFTASANIGTDRLTKTAHGMSNGEQITISNEGGELPGGLNEGYTYFVVGSAANDFQLAATSGGAAINLTTVGVGTHTVTPDQSVFWTGLMKTI